MKNASITAKTVSKKRDGFCIFILSLRYLSVEIALEFAREIFAG